MTVKWRKWCWCWIVPYQCGGKFWLCGNQREFLSISPPNCGVFVNKCFNMEVIQISCDSHPAPCWPHSDNSRQPNQIKEYVSCHIVYPNSAKKRTNLTLPRSQSPQKSFSQLKMKSINLSISPTTQQDYLQFRNLQDCSISSIVRKLQDVIFEKAKKRVLCKWLIKLYLLPQPSLV